MKRLKIHLMILLLFFAILLSNVSAQEYATWGLPEGAVARLGKGSIIGNIAFSPDGNKLAVDNDLTLRLWDLKPIKSDGVPRLLESSLQKSIDLAFSPDGKDLVNLTDKDTFQLWDIASDKEIALITMTKSGANRVLFSPNGTIIVTEISHNPSKVNVYVCSLGICS